MIIEIPRGYTFVKDQNVIAFEDNGILKIYGRRGKFQDVMYDLTYELKGRNKCYYCGTEILIPSKMTLDHIYPVSLGGPTIPPNLVPCCRKCNGIKENMTPQQYKVYRSLKDEEQKRKFLQEYWNIKYFQERWLHILPEEWISQTPISDLLVLMDLTDTNTRKYKKTREYYSRCKQFPKPIIVDSRGFVLDGFTQVLYAKNNKIKEIPAIVLENVEVIF